MKLGLVATDEAHAAQLLGLARAAAARGWPCRCFLTHTGVRLLTSAPLLELMRGGALRLDVCEHAWHLYGGRDAAPADVKLRSQFQNAELARDCDRVVVL